MSARARVHVILFSGRAVVGGIGHPRCRFGVSPSPLMPFKAHMNSPFSTLSYTFPNEVSRHKLWLKGYRFRGPDRKQLPVK